MFTSLQLTPPPQKQTFNCSTVFTCPATVTTNTTKKIHLKKSALLQVGKQNDFF